MLQFKNLFFGSWRALFLLFIDMFLFLYLLPSLYDDDHRICILLVIPRSRSHDISSLSFTRQILLAEDLVGILNIIDHGCKKQRKKVQKKSKWPLIFYVCCRKSLFYHDYIWQQQNKRRRSTMNPKKGWL